MRFIPVLCLLFFGVCYCTTSESNGTFGETIDGNGLYKLGRKLHKPILTLIGMVIRNLHQCEEWSPWTPCDVTTRGNFGIKTRQRTCAADNVGLDDVLGEHAKSRQETENQLCEGFCPKSYNQTKNGFCLKLNTTAVPYNEAAEQCQKEGGYLINIDSQRKQDDVKTDLTGFTSNIHIDGVRTTSSSSWTYTYGSQDGYLGWLSGYPNNANDRLCLALQVSSHLQYDYKCSQNRPFICEIPQDIQ